MKTKLFHGLLCAGFLLVRTAFGNSITITVDPTLAPNAAGSPSWNQWQANAITALENNASTAGTPGTPSYFQATTGPVDATQTLVTGFPSWLGQLNPASPYAAESGNRMTFAVAITTTDLAPSISLSEVGFDSSTNSTNTILTDGFGGVANGWGPGSDAIDTGIGYDWSNGWVGLIYTYDGQGNVTGATVVDSGSTTTLVNALFGRGSGNSVPAYCSSTCDAADQHAAIDAAVASMASITQFTGTYYLSTNSDESGTFASGSGTFDITGTAPEPGTCLLLLSGSLILLIRGRFVGLRPATGFRRTAKHGGSPGPAH